MDDTDQMRRIGVDPAAFEEFYRAHVHGITRFLARRVDDPYTVADLTAETFLAAIESASSYRPRLGTPRAWLIGIARHVLAGERRRAVRERRTEVRIAGRRLLEPDDIARLEERIDAARRHDELRAELNRLPAGERAVLELVALDGLTVTEAASVLRIRPGTARVRLHRARQAVGRPVEPSSPLDPACPIRPEAH